MAAFSKTDMLGLSFEYHFILSSIPFNPAIKDWKEDGKKVVGFFCSYVPEEILHAADILPYRIRPTGCKETTSADVYLSRFNCSFVRSCLEFAIKGEYKFLDGVVFENSCDHVRRLYDVFRQTAPYPFMHFISIPHKVDGEAIGWFKDEIINFKVPDKPLLKMAGSLKTRKDIKKILKELKQEEVASEKHRGS